MNLDITNVIENNSNIIDFLNKSSFLGQRLDNRYMENTINIDTTPGNWIVDIADDFETGDYDALCLKHGTVPRCSGWWTVIQIQPQSHFRTQLAVCHTWRDRNYKFKATTYNAVFSRSAWCGEDFDWIFDRWHSISQDSRGYALLNPNNTIKAISSNDIVDIVLYKIPEVNEFYFYTYNPDHHKILNLPKEFYTIPSGWMEIFVKRKCFDPWGSRGFLSLTPYYIGANTSYIGKEFMLKYLIINDVKEIGEWILI